MHSPILATKLYVPPVRPDAVVRPRLLERLNAGSRRKLTLVSAPAGFGKTTLVSDWVGRRARRVAWISLDEEHDDIVRFLSYLVAALNHVVPRVGESVLPSLRSSRPPPAERVLTTLANELDEVDEFTLVLDDYHLIGSDSVHQAVEFLLEHLPPQVHLVIATRAEPKLPLARLRARDQLTAVDAGDLRFTTAEAAEFLNATMALDLTASDVAALERRTEGWITGLQLAAVSLQGRADRAAFIASFTGSNRFVLDYLVEEVLQREPPQVQAFLRDTAILDRLCGPLCDEVLAGPSSAGQETLEQLERANLFLVPLDDERRWYRYHHLFRELLRDRRGRAAAESTPTPGPGTDELHRRASSWFETHGFDVDAFKHAAAAHDLDRAERLIAGDGMPLYFRGAGEPVLSWLESLPEAELDARPSLRVALLTMLTFSGRAVDTVAEQLDAAEAALTDASMDAGARNALGHIAALRAMLAIPHSRTETIVAQSRRALDLLHPDNLPIRTTTIWALGFGRQLAGDVDAARRSYAKAIALAERSGNTVAAIAAHTSLGQLNEVEIDPDEAAEAYRRVVALAGDPPLPASCEARLGLARVTFERNDLAAAQQHAEAAARLASPLDSIATPASCALLLARIGLARGELATAAMRIDEADRFVQRHGFDPLKPEVAAARALLHLRQGDADAAELRLGDFDLPFSRARVHLAQGERAMARRVLEGRKRAMGAAGQPRDRLELLIVSSLACAEDGSHAEARQTLAQAITLAEPAGLVRTFVDEGRPLARLLAEKEVRATAPGYVDTLLEAFAAEDEEADSAPSPSPESEAAARARFERSLYEPLSDLESKVLRLVAEGLSNQEIADRLHRAVSTIKGHNRIIFAKLQVDRRTEAVARARELGLL